MINISTYASIIFDCDGVILDSNQIKTNAFYKATLPWGYKAAKAFVEYHKSNGGVSRYVKFKYFLDEIAPEYSNKTNASSFETMIRVYENEVQEGLLNCNIAIGLFELRKMTSNAKWFCVSGSDQQELRDIFSARGLLDLFDGGVFGSPDSKDSILTREISKGRIKKTGLFIGDSLLDYEASLRAELDFVFVYGWTEMPKWKEFVVSKRICHIEQLGKELYLDTSIVK